jgi:hypothetical protein
MLSSPARVQTVLAPDTEMGPINALFCELDAVVKLEVIDA